MNPFCYFPIQPQSILTFLGSLSELTSASFDRQSWYLLVLACTLLSLLYYIGGHCFLGGLDYRRLGQALEW